MQVSSVLLTLILSDVAIVIVVVDIEQILFLRVRKSAEIYCKIMTRKRDLPDFPLLIFRSADPKPFFPGQHPFLSRSEFDHWY